MLTSSTARIGNELLRERCVYAACGWHVTRLSARPSRPATSTTAGQAAGW